MVKDPKTEPFTVGIKDACDLTGLGKTTIYGLAKAGELEIVKVGRRSLIRLDDLRALVAKK